MKIHYLPTPTHIPGSEIKLFHTWWNFCSIMFWIFAITGILWADVFTLNDTIFRKALLYFSPPRLRILSCSSAATSSAMWAADQLTLMTLTQSFYVFRNSSADERELILSQLPNVEYDKWVFHLGKALYERGSPFRNHYFKDCKI